MLAGTLPFGSSSAADVIDAIRRRSPPPLPMASPGLDRIVSRALAKIPDGRYQSAAEFRTDLEAALDCAATE
jgi:serine/threonine-protein kinase